MCVGFIVLSPNTAAPVHAAWSHIWVAYVSIACACFGRVNSCGCVWVGKFRMGHELGDGKERVASTAEVPPPPLPPPCCQQWKFKLFRSLIPRGILAYYLCGVNAKL